MPRLLKAVAKVLKIRDREPSIVCSNPIIKESIERNMRSPHWKLAVGRYVIHDVPATKEEELQDYYN